MDRAAINKYSKQTMLTKTTYRVWRSTLVLSFASCYIMWGKLLCLSTAHSTGDTGKQY